jgi:hypothetical protein
MDFFERCYERWKDDLSREFRKLHKRWEGRVGLEEHILESWKEYIPAERALISEIKGALRYRHWLAHGRYWEPKLGRRYDFASVYLLAQDMETLFKEQNN